MKEYLKRLARGSFVYQEPKMEVPVEELNLNVTVGTVGDFNFTIKATEVIKGIIWSSNERVVANSNTFIGDAVNVPFKVNSAGLAVDDIISGVFDIVTNAGEARVKYQVKVAPNTSLTNSGSVANLFQFSNLVQTAPEEAETMFVSEGFKQVIADDSFENLYELMLKGKSVRWEIEEFLIATKNKQPVTISVKESYIKYDELKESIQNSVAIAKSCQGYVSIDVKSDADFIRVATDKITADEFTGNDYELQYLLDTSLMHAGMNFGKIIFSTYNQKIEVVIEVNCNDSKQESSLNSRNTKAARVKLIQEYLRYRMKKQDTTGWLSNSTNILERARAIDSEDEFLKLAQAQLYITGHRPEDGKWLLENVKAGLSISEREEDLKKIEIYCYYLYVNSLALKDEAYTAKVFAKIKDYYENGFDSWKLLWLLFYLDRSYTKNISIKILRIKEVFRTGCTSPVMYMEAISVLNTQPSLLRVLNRFEVCVLQFAVKNDLVSEKLAEHVAFLIHNEKVATPAMIKILIELERKFESDQILEILVTQLIRNNVTGHKYFELYERGILRGLRITQLYEYYIKSIDKSRYPRLPKIVLMYFVYESNIDYRDKAYLYANVLKNESPDSDVMFAYKPHIEKFGYEQLKEKNIDDNLIAIYKYIWGERFIDEATEMFMFRLMFTYKVSCYCADVKNVVVKHKELKVVASYPVNDGVAYIDMYTDNCSIVLEGTDGVLRKDSVQYEIEKVFEDSSLSDKLLKRVENNLYVRIYSFENRNKLKLDNDACLINVLVLLKDLAIEDKVKDKLNSWLIDYYNNYYIGDDFKPCLAQISKKNLAIEDAVKLIEVCIVNDLYEDAYDLIKKYGYSFVDSALLFRMARWIIEDCSYEQKGVLTGVCYHIFYEKKYDEKVLKYLAINFNGTNEQMYDVWKACQNFNVDSVIIGESFLAQMLFTGQHNARSTEVFSHYLKSGGKRFVIHAYVAYHSYQYFVKQKRVNEIVFEVIESELFDECDLPDICKFALLKHYSTKVDKLEIQQLCLVEEIIGVMCRENKVFDFYKKFKDRVLLPYNVIDKTVVEFYGNPDSKVEIHFFTDEEQETPITEIMQNVAGVFTKSFTLFYGESVKYYFTSEIDKKKVQSEMFNIVNGNMNIEQAVGRFDYINDVLSSMEAHDIVTMRRVMHGYCVQDYIANQMFKPM